MFKKFWIKEEFYKIFIFFVLKILCSVNGIPGGVPESDNARGGNPRDFMLKEPESSPDNQITPMPPRHGGFHHFVSNFISAIDFIINFQEVISAINLWNANACFNQFWLKLEN